ncbi:MAG: metalloregulator ArsR/SmtB family transcription factor [Actinomycetota bacterium]|jgi:DNA-binding transcriptional ArsR family regulator|nr:metalloregulator ArsR/SmtB family transcription factor [Actinomycetota bacterium]
MAGSQPLGVDSIASVKAELFKAIAHPARIRALEILADGPRSVGDLQPDVGIESSHLSQQLAVLRRAGLVAARKEGNSVIYSIKDPTLTDLLGIARRLLVNSLTETRNLLADLDPTR